MRARRFEPYLLIISTCFAASCIEPEAREYTSTRSDTERALAERTRLANSGRFLAPRNNVASALTPADGQALVDALDIPVALRPTFMSGDRPDPDAAVVRASYGSIHPRNSNGTFLLLSTGVSGNETVGAEPGTDFGPVGTDGDVTTLQFQVTVPVGVNRMSFDYDFLSAESPEFIDSQFNDTFTATVSDAFGANHVIATASVNTAVFHPASDTTVGVCPFRLYTNGPAGVNTVFNQAGFAEVDAGTTGFQHVDIPVASGVVTITFDIRDLGDGILDSAVIIDNMKFSAIEMVDPQNGLIDTFRGQVLRTTTTDPSDLDRLATGGKPIHAAAADGVTQVLLRSNVPGPGQAVFSVTSGAATEGQLSADDGPPLWGSTATANAIFIDSKWYVFALYRSPPDFNTGTDATNPSRPADLAMAFTTSANETTNHDFAIEIVRPPVIIAPDIWSSCSSWSDINGLMSASPSDASLKQFTVTCAEYQTTSSKSFTDEDNRSVLDESIRQALQKLRDAGVAATRADVVGHGMGGLLARRYIDEPGYLRFDNFNAGGINRLITMSTPNLGSRLADEMIRTRNAMKAADQAKGTNDWQIAKDTVAQVGIRFDDADQDFALQEMGVGSPIVNQIGTTGRPSTVFYHAIIGTAGHGLSRSQAFSLLNGGVAGGMKNYFLVMEKNHPSVIKPPFPPGIPNQQSLIYGLPDFRKSVIFCVVPATVPDGDHIADNDQHDLFATTTEQRGGLDPAFTTSIPVSPSVSLSGHFNIQNDPDHTNHLIALLNAPTGGGQFAASMPSPGPQDRLNECPILPPLLAAPTMAVPALAARTLAITSPGPGTTVTPGSSISVTVDTGAGEVPEAVLIMSTGSSELVEAAPFTATVQIPTDALGSTSLRAIAFYSEGGMAAAEPVDLQVQTGATITSLEIVNGDQVLRRPGRARQLRAIATYSDGVRRDITQAAGTRYTISQLASIIQASDSGLLRALGPGEATVAVTNGAAITSVNVTVGSPACGDGIVDPGEECDDGNLLQGDGCSATCQLENRAPVAVCTSPTQCNDSGLCSANVANLGASSFDPDGDTLAFTQTPAGPYSVGAHAVTVNVSDGERAAECTSQVEVRDCEKPVLSCPADFTAECTGAGAATVTPPPAEAIDNCSVTVQAPIAGSLPLGVNQLTYTASDPSNNATSCTTTVTVEDTIAPVITCPAPIVAECTDHSRAFVRPGQAASSDICTDVTVNGPHPGLFPLGTTTVSYTANDLTGHQSSCSSTITVVDTKPPHVAAERRVMLWPPDHRYRTVNLDDCGILVEDACHGRLAPDTYQAAITCVTSNEPDDRHGHDDGHTEHDIVIVDDNTVKLRAERDADRDGRVYKIHFQVRDQAGNVAPGVCKVVVPHDQRCARSMMRHDCHVDDDRADHSVCRQH